MFAAQIPALNVAGEGHIRTYCGGLFSLLIFYVCFLFAALKLQIMLSRKRPFVVTNIDHKAYTNGEIITTAEPDFTLAMGVNNFLTGIKNDPRYFKWVAVHRTYKGGNEMLQFYDFHPCTDQDFANFDEPDSESKTQLQQYKQNGGLQCLDW